jgi:peptidoglycan hydrolase CwlO-like protein
LPALAAPSAELVEQVQTVARNLDALRRNVAELAAKQEKMSLNIAKLQAADKEIRQKLAAPRKTVPIASQQSVAQASSARAPPQATAQSNTQSPSAQSLSTQTGSEGRPGHVIRPVLRED